jgi:hypothetical protein
MCFTINKISIIKGDSVVINYEMPSGQSSEQPEEKHELSEQSVPDSKMILDARGHDTGIGTKRHSRPRHSSGG